MSLLRRLDTSEAGKVCTVEMSYPMMGLICSTVQGYFGLESARFMINYSLERTREEPRDLKMTVFYNWFAMHDYSVAARNACINFCLAQRRVTEHIHILTGSRLVAVGVALANSVLGNITALDTREAYQRAYDAFLKQRERTPPETVSA